MRTRSITNLYDGEIRYMDEQIGRVFSRLRGRGDWESSVIIVVGDHGQGLNQHDWPGHGQVWNELLRVPLMIRFPEGARDQPTRVGRLTSMMDVLPTALGSFPGPWIDSLLRQASGVDVLAADFEERPLLGQRNARECGPGVGAEFVLIEPRWRFHHNPGAPDRPDLLFDVPNDPHELNDLAGAEGELAVDLRARTEALIAFLTTRGELLGAGQAGALSEQTLRELRALGYLGGDDEDGGEADE
jgi:arylsulfatase A-like enzyme